MYARVVPQPVQPQLPPQLPPQPLPVVNVPVVDGSAGLAPQPQGEVWVELIVIS
jgi:hypothetical protein